MLARSRRSTTAAIALTAAITGAAALLSGCDPSPGPTAAPTTTGAAPTPAGRTSAAPTPTGPTPTGHQAATGAPSSAAPSTAMNGTANSALTISNGTNFVLMNGTSVDFGTAVRDLAWSPDGKKAAFINGSGDLVVSNPDGSGRVVAAKNPGGQTWSHPTWQVTTPDSGGTHIPLRNNLFFAASQAGVSRLEVVPANATNSTPAPLSLETESGENLPPLPQTGNTWPNGAHDHGGAVYANTTTGEVYIRDDYLRQQGHAFTKGSEPAMSPQLEEVAFVRSVDGHDHIFKQRWDGAAKDLTPHATTDYTEPAWSPDGKTIAARTPAGVATLPADGSAAPVQVSTTPGLPAYRD